MCTNYFKASQPNQPIFFNNVANAIYSLYPLGMDFSSKLSFPVFAEDMDLSIKNKFSYEKFTFSNFTFIVSLK